MDGTVKVPPRGAATTGPEGTARVGSNRGAPRAATLGHLPPGRMLLEEYQVEETLHPHETERPGIFRCTGPEGEVVVKVAATQGPPDLALWRRLPSLQHVSVLRTHEVVEQDGLFYEVQEFCAGGTMADLPVPMAQRPQWIEQKFVPSMNAGLRYLHERGIIHRDIKPANIYIRLSPSGRQAVIGDFDISSVLQGDQTSRSTDRADATWRYSAPETLPMYQVRSGRATATVSRTADYYSLGLTIIELLLGTTGLPGDQVELFRFYTTGQTVALPKGPERLVVLLSGLLILDRELRWGGDEVDRWYRNANTPEDLQRIEQGRRRGFGAAAQDAVRFGTDEAYDLVGLAEAMSRNPDAAKRDLMRGRLFGWIYQLDNNLGRKIEDDCERLRNDPDAALFRTILHCDPARPFTLPNGTQAATPIEWVRRAAQGGQSPLATADAPLARFADWLELKATPETGLAAKIREIGKTDARTRFEEAAYAIDSRLPYPATYPLERALAQGKPQGPRTPEEIVLGIMGSPADWASGTPTGFSGAVTRWKDGFLAAWLRQHGFAQQAQSAAAAATGVPGVEASFDVYLRHLHPLPPCEVTFDTGSLQTALTVPYGQSREIDVPYWTHGVGFPVGAVDLENAPPGLTLKEQRLTRREGNLRIGLDTRADMPAGFDSRQAQLRVAAGNFVIAGSLVPVPYRVLRPVGETVVRVLVGAVAGVALLGGSRLLAETFLPRAVAMADFDTSVIWKATTEWKLGAGGLFLGGFLIVVGAMVAGFYGFLAAWRKSEA